MTIRLLDESTISKISAGEIIENPASIVKELLENAIDANSKNIVIEIKGSIGEYIRITDDGDGIKKEELPLAFLRHSTSKLRKVEDLFDIVSLGFRGEALASISHISHVEIMTKHKDEKVGTRALVEHGEIIESNNVGLPAGTTFYIKDIFYNTPVRKKYLKNDISEFNFIQEVVQKIALSNNSVSIKLIRDGKIVLNTNKNLDLKNHIYNILGRDIASNLIRTDFKSESYKVKAFFSNNKLYRSNRTHQYVYINGRYIKNLDISRRIERGYYSLIPLNRYPVFILYIEIDPILVDVNIHPKKHEVKLSKENNIIAILGEMLEEVLYPNRSIENPIDVSSEKSKSNTTVFDLFTNNKNEDSKELVIETNFIDQNKYVEDNKSSYDTLDDNTIISNLNESNNEYSMQSAETMEVNDNTMVDDVDDNDTKELIDNSKIDYNLLNTRIVGTLFKTFIILEDSKNNKSFLVDQHAAHERIMYERLKKQYKNSDISKQLLLSPEIIELSASEKDNVENNIELFKSIGFDIEAFGENSIIIREVPILFGMPSYLNFIYDVINALNRDIDSSYDIDPYKIMKKACKAAVKAGDILSNIEINALLEDLIACENPYTCPHGRPTVLEFTKKNLEKMFLREV